MKENKIVLFSTIILGVIVGISSMLLSLLLDGIEQLFLNFQESDLQSAAVQLQPLQRLFSVFLGGIIASVIWWFIRTQCHRTVSVANALSKRKMPPLETLINVITQIFFVGTGGSVGRELAPREAGAMLAQQWNQLLARFSLQLSTDNQKLLIAAAAGAGFAGVYSAPLTGMLFCCEVLLNKVNIKTVSVSLIMSSISTLIGMTIKGTAPYYLVGQQKFSLFFLPFVLIVSPICGVIGVYFRKTFKWAEKNQTKNQNILWQLPLISLLTGIIATSFPQIMGNGRALAQLSINAIDSNKLWLLLLGLLLKAIITVISIRAGASGGTLTPSIAIGTALGAVFGLIVQNFIPGIAIWQCALIGGAGLLAASQQAPLMALMMIFEISHLAYTAFLPLGIGVSIAVGISKFILKLEIQHY
ncbi:chloride channel protein [Liquorilactobacillus satsumensis]|uniref:chloride channel protein n=1 Tax=Liquorilactobacillus satsumensis TaxID=259059 RepID=UPI0039EBF6DC